MTKQGLATFLMLTVTFVVAPQSVMAQSGDQTMPMRTPDGQPDVSGIFTFRTLTPMQRPQEFEGRETLTAEEAAAYEAAVRRRSNRDLFDPEKGAQGYAPRSEGGVLSYNEFWYERGIELTSDKRTSLIIDPPNGRRPPRVPPTPDPNRERLSPEEATARRYDSYENRSTGDRCIMGFNAGPPMQSSAYNNNVMIFQSPGYVTILNEMVHNARVIPIGDTTSPPFTQYSGVSRGHWEGEILVVQTTNFLRETSFVLGQTDSNLRLVERFTRVSPQILMYEATVDDPTVWSRAWTYQIPMTWNDQPVYEYACHEGNYGLYNILAGARFEEAAAEGSR